MPRAVADAPIRQLAALLRDGAISPLDLVEHCLARIERLDPQIRAWVLVDTGGARRHAERLADELVRGQDRGPLHGFPIGVKDIIDVAGMPTRAGSLLTDPNPVFRDAPVVAHLRDAGAIVLGKTVTCEWACFDPSPTRNPWNHERTPGGSSSGSAAAVACGMCYATIGTQTGGSITRPAAYCGVVGWKPARGVLSLEGVVPVSSLLDHVGIFARRVADAEAVLRGAAEFRPEEAFVPDGKPRRIARPSSHFFEKATSEVATLVDETIKRAGLSQLIETVELPASFSQVHEMHRRIMAHDAAQTHRAQFLEHGGQYSPQVASLIEEGMRVEERAYDEAIAYQSLFTVEMAELLEPFDAMVTPATPSVAPTRETTGDPRFNSPWSYCGVPTIAVPVGIRDGLPVAAQLIGRQEAKLGQLARLLESPLELPGDD